MGKFVRPMTDSDIVMSREEVREFDWRAINVVGVPGVVLMENAGRGCCEVIIERLGDNEGARVFIICGGGNNGGDGYVIARHLANTGFRPKVALCCDAGKIQGDGRINLDIIEQMDIPISRIEMKADQLSEQIKAIAGDSDMIIDAIFGTGLKGEVRGEYIELLEAVNSQCIPILSVDIPSGLDCDTGEVLGGCIKAMATVTFVAVKKGFTNPNAVNYTGEIYIASIGIA